MQRSGNLHRLTEVGWLKVFRDERSARRARDRSGFAARLIAECGIEAEHHDAGSLAELEPALRPVFKAAVVLPGGGLVDDPGALVAEHAARFAADGGELRRADVKSVGGDGRWLHYRTTDGASPARRLVVAAGPWSATCSPRPATTSR